MLQVGFLTYHNPYDRNSFSGTTYYMFSALSKHKDIELSLLGDAFFKEPSFVLKAIWKIKSLKIKLLLSWLSKLEMNILMKHIYRDIASNQLDVIVCPVSHGLILPLISIEGLAPIFIVTDATPGFLVKHYDIHKTKKDLESEELAVVHAEKVIYSSAFMADLAKEEYASVVDKEGDKILALSFGLNMDDVPDLVQPKDMTDGVNLLFVGRDWERKGGPKALLTHEALLKAGIKSTLHIVGCNPSEASNKDGVQVVPSINKNIAEQQKYYCDLLKKAHFLLLPTYADCTPMVIAEANAFGTPALTTNISGIPTLVEEGKNGFLLDVEAAESRYVEVIKREFLDVKAYQKLSRDSRMAYETRLNWDVWASSIYQNAKELN